MKNLKYLMVALVLTLVISCSKNNTELDNGYPKDVTIELKITSPNKENAKIGIMYMRGQESNNDEDTFNGTPSETLMFENITLPFTKKINRKVNYKDKIFFNIGAVDNEEDEDETLFTMELFIDGKSVKKINWGGYIEYVFK